MTLKKRDLFLALIPALITMWALSMMNTPVAIAILQTIFWVYLIHHLKYGKVN